VGGFKKRPLPEYLSENTIPRQFKKSICSYCFNHAYDKCAIMQNNKNHYTPILLSLPVFILPETKSLVGMTFFQDSDFGLLALL
jgi:hypothetical protein